MQDLFTSFFWGLPCSAGRQLSLTSGVFSRMSIGTIPWTAVCGTSQVFEPFHENQLLLFLQFCHIPSDPLCS